MTDPFSDLYPGEAAYLAQDELYRLMVEAAAKGLIGQMREAAERTGVEWSDLDESGLRSTLSGLTRTYEEFGRTHSPAEAEAFDERQRLSFARSFNRWVLLTRLAVEHAKKDRNEKRIRVRRGLVLTETWESAYQAIYQSGLPWFLSGVLQAAFMGNTAAGERHPWVSK